MLSASICPRCTGYVAYENQDREWCCLNCGHVVYRDTPSSIPPANRMNQGAARDSLKGVKPDKKSLAPNPGGARR